jgi:hypothetical protein
VPQPGVGAGRCPLRAGAPAGQWIVEDPGAVRTAHDAAIAQVYESMTMTARWAASTERSRPRSLSSSLSASAEPEEADLIHASVDPLALVTVPGLVEPLREIEEA